MDETILEYYEQGLDEKDIADLTGIPFEDVHSIIDKYLTNAYQNDNFDFDELGFDHYAGQYSDEY